VYRILTIASLVALGLAGAWLYAYVSGIFLAAWRAAHDPGPSWGLIAWQFFDVCIQSSTIVSVTTAFLAAAQRPARGWALAFLALLIVYVIWIVGPSASLVCGLAPYACLPSGTSSDLPPLVHALTAVQYTLRVGVPLTTLGYATWQIRARRANAGDLEGLERSSLDALPGTEM
jgi:hypothetical protein